MNAEYKSWSEAHYEEELELIKTIVSIPSPSYHEQAKANFILEYIKGLGYEGAYIDAADNVILPLAIEGRNDISVFAAHIDTVFDNEVITPHIEDGKIYAQGVGDDTANIVALLMVLKYIREKGLTQKEPVIFLFDTGEEGLGNLRGMREFMKNFEGRIKEFISYDLGYRRGIVTGAVSSERWEITCKTAGGHAFESFGNPSAIAGMAGLICRMYSQEVPKGDSHCSYNVGTITGGTKVNAIAAECSVLYEIRSDMHWALTKLEQQFEQMLAESKAEGVEFEIKPLGLRPTAQGVDPTKQRALADRALKAIIDVTGSTTLTERSESTDCNLPLSMGIPSICTGTYYGGGAHRQDEFIYLESITPGLQIAMNFILEYFTTAS